MHVTITIMANYNYCRPQCEGESTGTSNDQLNPAEIC